MVLKCYSIAFLFNWWIMKILDFVFSLCAFLGDSMCECICQSNSEYHAMLYLKHIFKESLCFCSITQVSSLWGEGAQDSCFCYSSHALLPHCKHPEYWQQKAAIAAPFCEPTCEVRLGGNERSADQRGVGIENWVRGSTAVQKHRESLRPQLSQLHDL